LHIDTIKGKEDLNVKSLGNSCTGETTDLESYTQPSGCLWNMHGRSKVRLCCELNGIKCKQAWFVKRPEQLERDG